MMLASAVEASDIKSCSSNVSLLTNAIKCKISACETNQHLIAKSAVGCEIAQCKSGWPLINDIAKACFIRNCIVALNINISGSFNDYYGGIAKILVQGSEVKNCLVTGFLQVTTSGYYKFSGVANLCEESIISGCVLGTIQRTRDVSLNRCIACNIDDKSILEKNIALDGHGGASGGKGEDGKSLSAALFRQHYFENTLDWNFSDVWQWDDVEGYPILQSVGVGSKVHGDQSLPTHPQIDDLLAQQMRANLWL
jgi:MoxR-like ATPase